MQLDRIFSRRRQVASGGSYPVDERYYPATDEIDWEPLRRHLCGGWMFMMVDLEGRRYYKNKATREYLILDEDGDPA